MLLALPGRTAQHDTTSVVTLFSLHRGLTPRCLVAAVTCRLCKRKQQMSLPARRQMGYAAGTGKKDEKRHVLLTEDVAEALKDVSEEAAGQGFGGIDVRRLGGKGIRV